MTFKQRGGPEYSLKNIKKILIANRAEMAIRIIKTCKEMGIETVSLFTTIEQNYPHAYQADYNVSLGDGPLSQTYLNMDLIIQIALQFQVDAIHPGYGLLSENPLFAAKVHQAGLLFIGPSPQVMTLMGSKLESKKKMEMLNVPLIPGYHGDNQEYDHLLFQAHQIGFPVIIKASAGGGGKGMRVVHQYEDFKQALESSQSEAMKAFGDDVVLIEKYIESPRHIEVQVFADQHSNVLHFFERECSIQRRHQKIIEETPSSALDKDLRNKICATAVHITKEIGYVGAGTIEFIMGPDKNFYFLEMNTRLQVEHPITEMVTGFDLVKLQIQVAMGHPFHFSQEQIRQNGHALEVRYYAEDADNSFMPSTGTVEFIGNQGLHWCRHDLGYEQNNVMTINFDPMISKLVVWGQNRSESIDRMKQALKTQIILGFKTNREYLLRILDHKVFRSGQIDTHFVQDYKEDLIRKEDGSEQLAQAFAAWIVKNEHEVHQVGTSQTSVAIDSKETSNPWSKLFGFRNV